MNEEKIICELDIRYGKNIDLNNILDRFKKVFCNDWNIKIISHKDLHYVDESNLVLKKLLEAYEEVTDEKGYTIAMVVAHMQVGLKIWWHLVPNS